MSTFAFTHFVVRAECTVFGPAVWCSRYHVCYESLCIQVEHDIRRRQISYSGNNAGESSYPEIQTNWLAWGGHECPRSSFWGRRVLIPSQWSHLAGIHLKTLRHNATESQSICLTFQYQNNVCNLWKRTRWQSGGLSIAFYSSRVGCGGYSIYDVYQLSWSGTLVHAPCPCK